MVQSFSQNFDNSDKKPFVISDFLEFLPLNPKGEKNKYECPNCDSHNLSISNNGFDYSCYNCCPNPSYSDPVSAENRKKIASILKKKWLAKYSESEKKSIRPKQVREWIYTTEGKPYIKVKRVDHAVEGKDKEIIQYHNNNGKWILGTKNHSQSKCDLLDIDAVKNAIANNELICIVEGEACVDSLRNLGFTATCNIGGVVTPSAMRF